MGYAVIRYGVKKDRIEENRTLIENVFQELGEASPESLRYLVLELDDGEFVHVVRESEGRSPLLDIAAFRAFTDQHAARRASEVVRKPARIVGSYRMLANGRQD